MADSTDIDVLVVAARATARELNELLEKLSMAGVRVSVIQPNRQDAMATPIDRVELGLVFPPERTTNRPQVQPAQQQVPYHGQMAQTIAQEQLNTLRHLKNRGVI